MKNRFAATTDPGLVRSVNQDAYYMDSNGEFFIVADGMGGHSGGQEASQIATDTIRDYLLKHWLSSEPTELILEKALFEANQAILQDQQDHPERADSGTTAVVVMLRDQQPMVAHVGDSRLYRLHGEKLEQITEDHTWVARAVQAAHITLEEARIHPWRHVLSQCLGREDLRQIDIKSFSVEAGDRLLLCSDGLTEELSESLIIDPLKSISDCQAAANQLVIAAKEKGGKDNITVVLVNIEE